MLEEILKSINSNLERIANALECKSAYTIGVDTSEGVDSQVTEKVTAEQANTYLPQPGVIQNSVGQALQQVVPQAIPTTQIQESFTFDQLAVAMSNAVSAGKMNIIQGILQQLNVQALTQVNPSDYNKVATMLKEAGVTV